MNQATIELLIGLLKRISRLSSEADIEKRLSIQDAMMQVSEELENKTVEWKSHKVTKNPIILEEIE